MNEMMNQFSWINSQKTSILEFLPLVKLNLPFFFPSKDRAWYKMFTSGLMALWDKKIILEHILQSIFGNGEGTFFLFILDEVDALCLKFINVAKAIPGENTGAVFP